MTFYTNRYQDIIGTSIDTFFYQKSNYFHVTITTCLSKNIIILGMKIGSIIYQ